MKIFPHISEQFALLLRLLLPPFLSFAYFCFIALGSLFLVVVFVLALHSAFSVLFSTLKIEVVSCSKISLNFYKISLRQGHFRADVTPRILPIMCTLQDHKTKTLCDVCSVHDCVSFDVSELPHPNVCS
jgi:hypothetical protein